MHQQGQCQDSESVDRFRCCQTKGRGAERLSIWLRKIKMETVLFALKRNVVVFGKFFVDVSLFSVLSVSILSHKFHCFLFMISSICVCFPYSFGGCAESTERGSAEIVPRVPKDVQRLQVSLYLDSRQSSKFAVTKSFLFHTYV